MIPQETIDRILDLTKVEEVIGDFVSLKRRGSSYVAVLFTVRGPLLSP